MKIAKIDDFYIVYNGENAEMTAEFEDGSIEEIGYTAKSLTDALQAIKEMYSPRMGWNVEYLAI